MWTISYQGFVYIIKREHPSYRYQAVAIRVPCPLFRKVPVKPCVSASLWRGGEEGEGRDRVLTQQLVTLQEIRVPHTMERDRENMFRVGGRFWLGSSRSLNSPVSNSISHTVPCCLENIDAMRLYLVTSCDLQFWQMRVIWLSSWSHRVTEHSLHPDNECMWCQERVGGGGWILLGQCVRVCRKSLGWPCSIGIANEWIPLTRSIRRLWRTAASARSYHIRCLMLYLVSPHLTSYRLIRSCQMSRRCLWERANSAQLSSAQLSSAQLSSAHASETAECSVPFDVPLEISSRHRRRHGIEGIFEVRTVDRGHVCGLHTAQVTCRPNLKERWCNDVRRGDKQARNGDNNGKW